MVVDYFSLASQILINLALNNLMYPLGDLLLILCLALDHLKYNSVPCLVDESHELLDHLFLIWQVARKCFDCELVNAK